MKPSIVKTNAQVAEMVHTMATVNLNLNKQIKEADKIRQRTDQRLEDLSDKGRGCSDDLEKLQQQIEDINAMILKQKQA